MITTDIKNKILAAIKANRANYPSDAKHAASLGITTSVYSAIKNGQTDRVLSDANWISIARKLGVSLRGEIEWKVAKTPTYQFITAQLEACQSSGISAILCDLPNIGKTFTARHYVKTHPNAIYIDCSQVKTKLKLVRKIAAEFGVDSKGRYADVYEDLVFYLRSIDSPIIILDEAGDLQYEAFLELKEPMVSRRKSTAPSSARRSATLRCSVATATATARSRRTTVRSEPSSSLNRLESWLRSTLRKVSMPRRLPGRPAAVFAEFTLKSKN